jgi:tRNA-Thr(GGU) m(6)t(6)A37 methyltransferase TsaA
MDYLYRPIAFIRSPYREKFSAPRQPGLAPSVRAHVEFLPEFASPEAVRGLDGFSHIWLIFLFHQTAEQGWKPTVRPPRLGGNKRVGVFSCRSPFRPNPIGLSAVKLLSVNTDNGTLELEVQGADLIDGTPILDIKPYLPYTDGIPEATGGFAGRSPVAALQVKFSTAAHQQLGEFSAKNPELEILIRETLTLDPRPAYQQEADGGRVYGVLLDRYNVRWRVEGETVEVIDISLA